MDRLDKNMQDGRVKLTQDLQRDNLGPLFCVAITKQMEVKMISIVDDEEEEFRIIEEIYTQLKSRRTAKPHIN